MFFSTLLLTTLTLVADPTVERFAPDAPMVVTVGNDVGWQINNPEEAREAFKERGELRCGPEKMRAHWEAHGSLYADHGATAFEPYVKWMLLEPEEGVWDPAFYDAELATFKEHGLKWVPFLIAGPAYATPPWFKESGESVFAVDLDSGDVTRDQSIWNPHLKPRIRAWLERFFDHYDQEDMQAVLLGISGVFGEAIYTAGGNEYTQIWDGEYPQHIGWWCGDRFAKTDFIRAMRAKYDNIALLNKAWETEFVTFDEVAPFVPDDDWTMRARLDLTRWYMGAMTDYAAWWVATTRELASEVPILLCTGGRAYPELGADMSAQAKMVAQYGAGIRITNEASDYGTNLYLTRMIGSACLHYDTYFGYEPAGGVDNNGIVARIYNAVASGAWELFHYDNPPRGDRGDHYKRYRELMRIREPVVEVGYFWSRTSADLKLQRGLASVAHGIRDLCDVAYLDERLIADGALEDLKVFVWASGHVTESDTARAIERAVKRGLTLIVPEDWEVMTPEGRAVFPSTLWTRGGASTKTTGAGTVLQHGDGFVIQSSSTRPASIAEVVAMLIRDPDTFGVPALSPEASIDGKPDNLYLTVTTRDILLLNHSDEVRTVATPEATVEVSPHSIKAVTR